jgi:hypothetical protein
MKATAEAPGQPLLGADVKVSDGYFWIVLSAANGDIAANLALLRERDWIDLPLVYETGQRAIRAFEKGEPGQRVCQAAMAAWTAGEAARSGATASGKTVARLAALDPVPSLKPASATTPACDGGLVALVGNAGMAAAAYFTGLPVGALGAAHFHLGHAVGATPQIIYRAGQRVPLFRSERPGWSPSNPIRHPDDAPRHPQYRLRRCGLTISLATQFCPPGHVEVVRGSVEHVKRHPELDRWRH